MTALPSGVVAFLMLDVEASTQGWNDSAPEMQLALEDLDHDVRSVVGAHSGAVIKARGEGDSHFCAFETASDAVAAAAAIQRRADQRLAVRGALLLGEARPQEGDYVGSIVNHGARIRSAAHGGQVVATASVVEVASPHLPPDLSFQTLGPQRIRDVPSPIELFQLHGAELRRSFPALRTDGNRVSTVMAVAVVDVVASSVHFTGADDELLEWQRELIHTLRELSDAHDGRQLKLVGDGCVVGFEDPRRGVEFAHAIADQMPVRVGIALGMVDVVEGELVGRVPFDAYLRMRGAGKGEVRTCELLAAMCPDSGRSRT